MNKLQILVEEAQKMGLSYMLTSIKNHIFHDEASEEIIKGKRAEYYSSLSPDQLLDELNIIYNTAMKRNADIRNPETFTEKIQWMKIMEATPEKTRLTDKLEVKEWIADKIGKQYVVPTVGGGWKNFNEIDFEKLPEQFILKMNTGSGMNYLVPNKNSIDFLEVKRLFDKWIKVEYCWNSLEMQYRGMDKKIFAEKYVEEMNGNLYDYKIHCFDGKPSFIQLIGDRDLRAHTGAQRFFDVNWNRLDWTFEDYPDFTHEVEKPSNLDEMLEIAKKLSEDFNYVRVDLYNINGKVLFGEMTFTPASGIYPYKGTWNYKIDLMLGNMLHLTRYSSSV